MAAAPEKELKDPERNPSFLQASSGGLLERTPANDRTLLGDSCNFVPTRPNEFSDVRTTCVMARRVCLLPLQNTYNYGVGGLPTLGAYFSWRRMDEVRADPGAFECACIRDHRVPTAEGASRLAARLEVGVNHGGSKDEPVGVDVRWFGAGRRNGTDGVPVVCRLGRRPRRIGHSAGFVRGCFRRGQPRSFRAGRTQRQACGRHDFLSCRPLQSGRQSLKYWFVADVAQR